MPAAIRSEKVYGMKWVSVFPQNPHLKGKANLTAVYILSELGSGYPIAFMEGSLCSNIRTAAVGGVAAKYLARKDSKVIGFIGAGEQAKSHLLAMKAACPSIEKCYVSSRTNESEDNFVKQMSRFCPDIAFIKCEGDYKGAVENADIIVTAISGQEKILQAEWVKNGAFYCHVAGLSVFGPSKNTQKSQRRHPHGTKRNGSAGAAVAGDHPDRKAKRSASKPMVP